MNSQIPTGSPELDISEVCVNSLRSLALFLQNLRNDPGNPSVIQLSVTELKRMFQSDDSLNPQAYTALKEKDIIKKAALNTCSSIIQFLLAIDNNSEFWEDANTILEKLSKLRFQLFENESPDVTVGHLDQHMLQIIIY